MLTILLFDVVGGIVGLWVASHYIQGVQFTGSLKIFLIAGAALGLVLAFLRPILNLITFVFRLIVLIGVSVGLIWLLGMFFPEFSVKGTMPMIWTAVAISAVSIVLSFIARIGARR